MKKEPKQNLGLVFDTTVYALQQKYNEYKEAINAFYRYTFYNDNGEFSILAGHEDRSKKVEELEKEVIRLKQAVDALKGEDAE